MKSQLIGHRGEPESWPENSLLGFKSVLEAGACYIETDIQITADGVALLSHDASAHKITGRDLPVTTTDYETLRSLPAGYAERFGDKFHDLRITRLDELVELLKKWPNASAFIEVKQDSITAHGIPMVAETIIKILGPVLQQCILISFNYEILTRIRSDYQLPIGWVLSAWNADSKSSTDNLAPEYLFCDQNLLPPVNEPLWQGPWQWAIYTVNNVNDVTPLLDRGIQLVETNIITQMFAHVELNDSFSGD